MNFYILLGLAGLIAIPAAATGIYVLSGSNTTSSQDNSLSKSVDTANPEVTSTLPKSPVNVPKKEEESDDGDLDMDFEEIEETTESPKSGSVPELTENQLKYPKVTINLMQVAKQNSASIGSRYESYLLSEVMNDAWKDKVKKWVSMFLDDAQKNKLTKKFILKKNNERVFMSITNLQTRCKQAYSKTDWKKDFGSDTSIDPNDYWNTVKELCGKPNSTFPSDWNPNK